MSPLPPRVSPQAARRRRLAAGLATVAALAAFVAGAVAGSGRGGETPSADTGAEAEAPPELPGGGRVIFPDRRVVAFYGAPQDEELGELGIGRPAEAGKRLIEQAEPYERENRPVLPAFELIATIAAGHAGERGDYNIRQPRGVINRYLKAARNHDALLILDIQPGYTDFMDEVRRFERYLREPDVGLALDPEWALEPPAVPGQVIGSVDAEKVNEVSAYLQELVEEHTLPQKLLIVHQFTDDMISRRGRLQDRPDVAIVLNSDGFGSPAQKEAKYRELRPRGRTSEFHAGFKLFYREDAPLMKPRDVMALRPRPELVIYE